MALRVELALNRLQNARRRSLYKEMQQNPRNLTSKRSAATRKPLSYHDSNVLVISGHCRTLALVAALFLCVLSIPERLVSKWHSATSTNPKAGK